MEDKSLYELGVLAQNGDDMAMMEIISRKKSMIKRYSYGDEDTYQYIVLKLIEGIKNYNFKNFQI
ncbi:MAG: helix-turn-helix domain-containing protein [Clostridia bacterium]|nr:helix-turn-helix domain-containing protein [Clostridia bacterium]